MYVLVVHFPIVTCVLRMYIYHKVLSSYSLMMGVVEEEGEEGEEGEVGEGEVGEGEVGEEVEVEMGEVEEGEMREN